MTTLRPYQREAIDAVRAYWTEGGDNPLVCMATGTGKSVVIATLTRELVEQYRGLRVLMLTHVKELVAQNAAAMVRTWPQCPIGINSAGLNKRDTTAPVLFASVQSVFRQASRIGPRDVIMVDEAHLVPKAGEGMYQTLLDGLRRATPDLRVVGFTATPYRLDSGRLDEGDGRLFSDVVYDYGIARGVADGYLSPLISKATATAIDTTGVARRGGEFVAGALEAAVDQDWITRAAVDEIVTFGTNRRSWLAFCAGVAHAENVRNEIRRRGFSCEMVTGDTPHGERDAIIRGFKAGQIRCLTNAMVLTTGFDAPAVDLVAMLRPTLSTGLYVQIVGRGTRLAEGKADCLVLDFAGNVKRHGPVDQVQVKSAPVGKGKRKDDDDAEVRAKECPNCATYVGLNARRCYVCDHEWPIEDQPKHDPKADGLLPIMSTGAAPWIEVASTAVAPHNKFGAPTSLRVEYDVETTVHKEWVCFEHTGYARQKAESWWRKAGGLLPVPATVNDAIERLVELKPVTEILVKPNGRFHEIIGKRYGNPSEAGQMQIGGRSVSIARILDDEIPF